ncbi:hypothetical protein V2J09_016801 [Rumex salicifolius]
MKIQCDVCESQPATVFCSADEAALCHLCDRRVHHANKLAGKHLRFSLLAPSPADSPLCDICQERRAFLFCKEDRAILCRECDVSIHCASEHTQRHSRFLLTGVKISAAAAAYPNSSASSSDGCGHAASPPSNLTGDSVLRRPVSSSDALGHSRSTSVTTSYHAPCYNNNDNNNNNTPYQMGNSDQEGSISTSDYNVADCYTTSSDLMAMGPTSWHVDDFFYSSTPPDFFASKNTLPNGAQQADSRYGYRYY